jgi:hypothetical protein
MNGVEMALDVVLVVAVVVAAAFARSASRNAERALRRAGAACRHARDGHKDATACRRDLKRVARSLDLLAIYMLTEQADRGEPMPPPQPAETMSAPPESHRAP